MVNYNDYNKTNNIESINSQPQIPNNNKNDKNEVAAIIEADDKQEVKSLTDMVKENYSVKEESTPVKTAKNDDKALYKALDIEDQWEEKEKGSQK